MKRTSVKFKCSKCGKEVPANLIFSYVDGNNEAISKHAKHFCLHCYNEEYPWAKISLVDILRERGHQIELNTELRCMFIDGKQYDVPFDISQLEEEYLYADL